MLAEILALPCWTAPIKTTRRLSGLTGGSVLVEQMDGRRFVVRTQTPNMTRLGVERRQEYNILTYLSQLDFLPKVRFKNSQFLVLDWLDGMSLQDWNHQSLIQFAQKMAQWHSIAPNATLPILDLSAHFLHLSAQLPIEKMALFTLPNIPQQQFCCITHNDLNPNNIIMKHGNLNIIDWEYAAVSEPAYEIAAFWQANTFSKEQKACFLQHYLNNNQKLNTREFIARIEQFCAVSAALNRLWFAVQQDIYHDEYIIN